MRLPSGQNFEHGLLSNISEMQVSSVHPEGWLTDCLDVPGP